MSADELLTVDEVAAWLRVPTSTVRYWRSAGKGPRSINLGRRVVYRRVSVEQWLQEKEGAA